MQITLPTREVRDALTGLARVINSRTSLPILHGVRISASPSGQVRAEATDLDSSASYTFNSASCEGNGAFILGLDLLKPFAQGNGPGTLTFDCADDTRQVNVTTFVGGQALRRTLAGFDPGDWPELRPVDMKTAPVPGFIDAYRTLAPFASTDETRYVLNSVHLDVSEKQADGSVMVATDGRRLACKNHMTLPLDESCVLRTSKFLTWTRLPADAEIGLAKSASGATIGVKAGPWQFTTKAIDGVFPNWRQVVPAYTDVENHVTLSDSDCELLLKALPTLPGDSSVTLVGREGTFAIWAHGVEDKNWTVLQIPGATYQGAAVAYTTIDPFPGKPFLAPWGLLQRNVSRQRLSHVDRGRHLLLEGSHFTLQAADCLDVAAQHALRLPSGNTGDLVLQHLTNVRHDRSPSLALAHFTTDEPVRTPAE
jgi:DNA polymerase III sliding clamp (beta) subunit (PCNA family)